MLLPLVLIVDDYLDALDMYAMYLSDCLPDLAMAIKHLIATPRAQHHN
jgi:hypothetical protein